MPASPGMKLVFFNRFFHPDTSATSQILSDLAFHLAAGGREVHVVTSRVPGGEAAEERIGGVTVHRVTEAPSGRHGLFRRMLAYARFYVGARGLASALIAPGDIVILKTDPPLLSSMVGFLAKRRGAKVVVWLQDIFPEVAHEYGVPGMGGPLGAVLRRMRDRSLAIADEVVVIGERMAARLAASTPSARVRVIHNWADGEAIRPVARDENPLRRKWGLRDEFVVCYSGNLGRVHEFDTLLGAASRLRDEAVIRFLIVGRGPRLAQTEARAKRERLGNVRFEPHQQREALGASLGVADVHLSCLQPGFEGLVHPSKLYGIMAAGRPTIFVGDAQGETASILARFACGTTVATGDADGLAAAILAMRADDAERNRMGQAARRAFDAEYARPIAFAKWEEFLASIAGRPASSKAMQGRPLHL